MIEIGTWLDGIPVWGVGLGLIIAFALAAELGFVVHRKFGRDGKTGEANDEGQVLSTALLLLALLIGFTFSMALGRFDDRRAQVVQEANDIGTAWLRAGLADNAAGKALQGKLADYAATRIAPAAGTPQHYAEVKAEGDRLRDEIWTLTTAAISPDRSTAQAAALVSAVNAVLDTATTRETAIDARVPAKVIVLLMLYATVSAFLLGYVLGAYGSHHRGATTLLFILLAMTITIILDLDRPRDGGIKVSQQAMIDLVADLKAPR
ncbi:MAG: hypothetical protein RL490_1621 [Pseudomonadota bacterium]|jgi:hypothetical protein